MRGAERTLMDCERVLGDDHPDTLHTRTNLARAPESAENPDHAIPLHESTLENCEQVLSGGTSADRRRPGPPGPGTLPVATPVVSGCQVHWPATDSDPRSE